MRVGGAVEAAAQAERQGRGRLHVERQVGQHLLHQRLVDKLLLEHGAVPAVVDGVGQRQAHQPGGAHGTVEPRAGHHLDDGGHAAPFLADQPGVRGLELHLRGGIGAVAELVLEPLEAQRIDAAVGQEARHQEAGKPARRLRQHQEGVAHRRRHEPLVAGDDVFRARPAGARRHGGRGVGAHVGAALLLGHAHADGDAALGAQRARSACRTRATGSWAANRRRARAAAAASARPRWSW